MSWPTKQADWHGFPCPCGDCTDRYCGVCDEWEQPGHSHLKGSTDG